MNTSCSHSYHCQYACGKSDWATGRECREVHKKGTNNRLRTTWRKLIHEASLQELSIIYNPATRFVRLYTARAVQEVTLS
jgi:hypothetical protein